MRASKVVAAVIAIAAIGCFERGGGKREAEPAPAAASAAPTDLGWAVRDPDGAPDPDAVVRIALEAEPATLDPFATLDAVSGRELGAVVEGLLCAPDGGAVIDCVAASHTVSDGGRRWRFVLDPTRRFSDGAAVTAADVVASLRAARGDGHAAGPLGAILDDASAIEPDGEAIELRFATARPGRARDLTLVPIVPAAQLAHPSLATAPIGTGPLRIAAWDRGSSLRLVRVPGAARAAAAAEIRFVITADRADAIRRLIAGELELVGQVPIDLAIATTGAQPTLARFRYALPAYLAAVYNTRRLAPSVRRALTLLLDRAGVARAVLGGARTLTGPYLPDTAAYDPSVAPPPFDRAAARGLLAGERPSIELLVPAGSTTTARIADVWASDARGVIALRVTAVPFPTMLARLAAGDFDVAITSMSAGPDVDLSSRLASDAPADQAWPGLADRLLDAALAEAQLATGPARRIELAHAIHRRVAELAPMAFIAVDTRAGLAQRDLGGVVGTQAGPPPVERLWKRRR